MNKNLPQGARVFLFGASGHAKVILDSLRLRHIEPAALIDDNPNIKFLVDLPVFNSIEESGYDEANDFLIISIGDNMKRKEIATRYINSKFTHALHSNAIISESVIMEEGTVAMANVSINADSIIGKHCIINTNASVDHECIIGDYVHISPNVALAGNVTVGEGTHVGIGATVIQNVHIGKWVTIGGGAVIIRDVPDYAVVVGNPGRIIKYTQLTPIIESVRK